VYALLETSKVKSDRTLFWDKTVAAWVVAKQGAAGDSPQVEGRKVVSLPFLSFVRRALSSTFLPESVTEDYYTYVKWKCFQRFVSSTVNVLGVQALLLALGVKTEGALGVAAATSWVLKDALGKMGRIGWAGKMGSEFDADSKRWRFRSSILYAAGNGLEIVTYVFPAYFVAIAACANLMKQISMLTSSATRNAIYRSFSAQRNNIGEISAKSEAQIAVVDLVGMLAGIKLSQIVGSSHFGIGIAYLCLSSVDLFSIYKEIRSVVFKDLNFERLALVLQDYASIAPSGNSTTAGDVVLAPSHVATKERIFRNPWLNKGDVFKVLSDLPHLSPERLGQSLTSFQGERYALIVTEEGQPHVLMHQEARSRDTAKAVFTYFLLKRRLDARAAAGNDAAISADVITQFLAEARAEADARQDGLLETLQSAGWSTERFMLPVPKRMYWDCGAPPQPSRTNGRA
jgi:hypothetical protein